MQNRKRLLIIRPGAIGDTLLTMPLLQSIRYHHPDLDIHFVGNPLVLPLLHAFALVDRSSNYDDSRWSYLFMPTTPPPLHPSRLYEELQQELQQCDTVIAWLQDDDGIVINNVRLQHVPHIIVASGRPPAHSHQHITDYLAHTLVHEWPIWQNWDAQKSWRPPAAYNWQPPSAINNRPTIAIHPGSGGLNKCWPLSAFAQLIGLLWQRDISILLVGGPADEQRVEQLLDSLQPPAPTSLRVALSAPLLYVTQQLQHCHSYVGNDTGTTHLAALLGIPTIAVFGPSDPTIWHPIGPHVTILHEPVLEKLLPLDVLANIPLPRS
jgi:heptosyltransferase III